MHLEDELYMLIDMSITRDIEFFMMLPVYYCHKSSV